MIIDIHTHVYDRPDYISMLAETAQEIGFDKLCIGGGETRYGLASNEEVREEAEAFPELFLPFAYIRPGINCPGDVEQFHRQGFTGLKVAPSKESYASPEFLPVLQTAEAIGMPVLFHTRIPPASPLDRGLNLNSEFARPIYLDTLARKLPDLKIIGTGLGAPWYEEAAALLDVHENVFFDLSKIRLRDRGANFFKMILGGPGDDKWDQAPGNSRWKQILFGTASENREIPFVERDYQRLFRALALPEEITSGIMGDMAGKQILQKISLS